MLNEYDIWRPKIGYDIISGTIGDIGIDIGIGISGGGHISQLTRQRSKRGRKAGEDEDHTCVRHGCILVEADPNLF